MFDFQEKRKLKQFLYSKITLVVLVVVVGLLLNSVWNIYTKERETRIVRKNLEREFLELQEREELLREEIERLKTPRGIEEEIRSKFEVSKDGEKVMVIVDPTKDKETQIYKRKNSFWSKFLNFFIPK